MAKKKSKTLFECQHCGYQSLKYLGKCPNCKEWDSFIEIKENMIPTTSSSTGKTITKRENEIISIKDIEIENIERISTKDSELDLV